jgi:pre-rRNA-processing protein TSR4
MWSDGADTNEHDEPILLLQPIITSNHKNKKHHPSPSSCHIGGSPCFYPDDISSVELNNTCICTVCNGPMHLLLQLNAPLDDLERTLYVFGCNRPSCHTALAEDVDDSSRFRINFDRWAVIRCFRSQQQQFVKSGGEKKQISIVERSEKLEDNDWGDDNDWGADDDPDDDWGAAPTGTTTNDSTKEVSMDELEAMLSKAEVQSKASNTQYKSTHSKDGTNHNTATSMDMNAPSFQRYNLEMFNEPPSAKLSHPGMDDDDEDDDVVSSVENIHSSKVNQMLSQYLAMEEDEDILSALKGGGTHSSGGAANGGGGGEGGEKYERLPPEERAFLAFSKRLKRAPLQVVRYAYGGVPLWSV